MKSFVANRFGWASSLRSPLLSSLLKWAACALLLGLSTATPAVGQGGPAGLNEREIQMLREHREEMSRQAIETSMRRQMEEGRLVGRAAEGDARSVRVPAKPAVVRVMPPEEKKAVAHLERGLTFFSKNQFDEALREYKEAIRLAPKMSAAYNDAGSAFFALGRYQEAVESFRQSINLDPQFAQAYFNLGLMYLKQGREAEATQVFQSAANAYLVSGEEHLKASRLKEAEEAFLGVVRIDPHFYLPYLKLSFIYEDQLRHAEAIQAALKALALQPRAVSAHYILGRAYLALGQKSRAVEEYERLRSTSDAEDARELYRRIYGHDAPPEGASQPAPNAPPKQP